MLKPARLFNRFKKKASRPIEFRHIQGGNAHVCVAHTRALRRLFVSAGYLWKRTATKDWKKSTLVRLAHHGELVRAVMEHPAITEDWRRRAQWARSVGFLRNGVFSFLEEIMVGVLMFAIPELAPVANSVRQHLLDRFDFRTSKQLLSQHRHNPTPRIFCPDPPSPKETKRDVTPSSPCDTFPPAGGTRLYDSKQHSYLS